MRVDTRPDRASESGIMVSKDLSEKTPALHDKISKKKNTQELIEAQLTNAGAKKIDEVILALPQALR